MTRRSMVMALLVCIVTAPDGSGQERTTSPEFAVEGWTPEAWLQEAPRAQEYTSPVVAGVLSLGGGFIGINGLGSYYAGNEGHGTRHLLVGFGAIALVIAGFVTCDGLGDARGCDGSSGVLMTLGWVSYLGNWGWSVATAARDAEASNVLPPGHP